MVTAFDERVLVLAPTERDAALSRSMLADAGLACQVCGDLGELCREFARGAGAILLTEEALASADSHCLVEAIRGQPAWSDVPVLLLCGSGADSPVAIRAMDLLGNVTVLERPVRLTTLVSSLRTALKARQRQYELRKNVEAARESEERFRQLANAMPQIVWTARPDGYVDYYNERWYAFTGFPRGRFGQMSWEPILHPDDLPRSIEEYYRCIQAGETYQGEYRFKDRKTGGYRWFLARAMPVRDERGRIVRWFGTCTDIDDTKRAEEALRDADRRKDEFLAMLAHELRNPLAPIRNALHILQLSGADETALQRVRAMAERQVEHMARLLDDLLDVSRISRGRIELRKESVDVATVANRTVEAVRPFIEQREHELTVTLPKGPLHVEADPTRLEQILTNLLNNAAKYTDPGGHIDLVIEQDDGDAVLRVRDTGIGIETEMLPRIFDLFVQAERRLDRSQGGVGIGLTMVKKLVELHGGTVEAKSEGLGHGSEFVIRLPALPEEAEQMEPEPPNGTAAYSSRCRILVVDDNVDAADSAAMLLRLTGQDVRVAYDGPTALVLAEGFHPQVVLLDIGMPGMDGYEVAHRLRQQPAEESSILVALTGWGQEEDRRRSKEAGFDYHLTKPVDPSTLENLLGSLFPDESPSEPAAGPDRYCR